MSIYVEAPGMLTTIQDGGRFGYQQYGVSPAGPMDPRSFFLANILAGNPKEEGALEITFPGARFTFEESNVIAIAGGDLGARLNGQPVPLYQAVEAGRGKTLEFTSCRNGCRAYLAFAGGLNVPVFLGSKSTLMRNHMGGMEGRKLEKGDRLEFSHPEDKPKDLSFRRIPQEKFPSGEAVLRVVPGPQYYRFTLAGRRRFFQYGARITSEFDRMGCRLECEIPIEQETDGNIISDGITFGSIQIPTDGQPIIMMADRQTTGGYTKIGTVITPDLTILSQCVPGMRLRFVEVSVETAQLVAVRQIKRLEELEWKMNGRCRQEEKDVSD